MRGNPELETVKFPNGDACQFFVPNFFARSFSGDLVMRDGESLAVEWFATGNLPEMLPNMAASIRAYEIFRTTSEFQMI